MDRVGFQDGASETVNMNGRMSRDDTSLSSEFNVTSAFNGRARLNMQSRSLLNSREEAKGYDNEEIGGNRNESHLSE
eukprot:CAMPEP_0170472220 /NCGR_PEP_ID=MMETSP0123-20130129/14287_2 /TAXON_ID=182087 /ORGANISM="Favella ehrenbergii, Strain Fehren 1" /LENGTH=76 /DNA_ID=CAMNT_0010740345 /DNA_START=989 /DNA_END=1219 /DNA_ORIENTATION=-